MLYDVTGRPQSDKGGRGLVWEPGPHSWPSWPLVPSAPQAPTPAITPQYVRYFGRRSAPPLTIETVIVPQLNEYHDMMEYVYIHSLKRNLSNAT